jgi:hypothetical protein
MMLEVLSSVQENVLFVCSALIGLVSAFFSLSQFIGQYIVTIVWTILSFIFNFFFGLCVLVQILLEDFIYFVVDTVNYVVSFENFLSYLAHSILHGITTLCLFLGQLCEGVQELVGFKLWSGVVDFLVLLKGSILLIGAVAWAIPTNILLFIYNLLALLVEGLWSSWNLALQVPTESALGLILTSCLFYLNLKLKGHRKLWKYLSRTARKFPPIAGKFVKDLQEMVQICLTVLRATLRNLRVPKHIFRPAYWRRLKNKLKYSPSKLELMMMLEKEKEDKTCIVCMDKRRSIVLVECRHFCMCEDCVHRLYYTSSGCPICRIQITDFWSVYT